MPLQLPHIPTPSTDDVGKAKAGVPRSAAKVMGQRTESVYRRYGTLDEDALKEGVEKLAELPQDKPEEDGSVVSLEEAREA